MKKIDRKGFTLVETIIAVAILAVVSVPVVGMFVQTARVDSKARQMQKATDLAQNMMESIREYTMEQIIDQCINVDKDTPLLFMIDWCPNYKPDGYLKTDSISDDAEILEGLDENVITGNLLANYNQDEKVYIQLMGKEIRFIFMGIPYNKSYFDAIITFKCPEEFKAGTYYLYDVTVSIYQSFQDSHIKLSRITGAIQNK